MVEAQNSKLSDEEIQTVVQQLEQADENHREWLRLLHSSLICGDEMQHDVLLPDAHRHCQFGHWYYGEADPLLTSQPEFIDIESMHKEMHDAARAIAETASRGEVIEAPVYRNFIGLQQCLSKNIQALRDQMREYLYSFDALTGVMTRIPFERILAAQRARSERSGEPCTLALLDIDHFKRVNDEYGHLVGDRVLRKVAQLLLTHLRRYDAICRYGGEEFLLCLPGANRELAAEIMGRHRAELEAENIRIDENKHLKITVSIGVCEWEASLRKEECLQRADQALYQAKASGRNRVCLG